jgi:DNA mismatch repair protein MutS
MEEGVLGLPPGLEGKREELTPMLTQYAELCLAYEDALVLFQVGDFYEAFCEAAEAVSRELEITLTKREDSTGTYPMAGIPIDNAQSYLERLLEAGYRVAIADQVQDPADSTGPVDRAVTRVLTPGTVIDEELLEPGSSNYVACLAGSGAGTRDGTDANDGDGSDDADTDDDPDPDDTVGNGGGSTGEEGSKGSEERSSSAGYAVAFADVSTGEFLLTSGSRDTVADELDRFDPAEVLFAPEIGPETFDRRGTARPPREGTFGYENAADRVTATGGSLADLTMSETRACGALLAYIEYTRGDASEAGATHDGDDSAEDADENRSGSDGEANVDRDRFGAISRYEPAEFLRLDATALRSLEVFDDRSGGEDHTLFSVLDDASCALGRRRLAGWLRRPLLDVEAIEARHDAVSELLTDSLVREELRELLRDVYDLSRLSTRVSRGRANARDLRSLADTLGVVPHVREALSGADSGALAELRAALEDCGDVRGLIERAIRPDPPIEITEGGLIEPGFDDGLDSLRETEQGGKEWVAELEASERERTGIDSLSVGFNQVHGYYIEVTKANLEDVPEEYTRRQTLKNAERFYTPDLKRREEEILSAGERADEREYELFGAVRAQVGAEADRIDRIADVFADLDVFCTLAAVASERDYVRPAVGCETLSLRGGRHPVVEEVQGSFVPNDVSLGTGEVGIITGPNMAGKSTYMRQVALCSLLAQIGSFVPAREAQLPIVDRIFTRIGASDDIAGGQSTFMREMTELATILREASEDSLVILDEVGRGTSTADGRAIARAAIEGLHDAVGARTLFATHYHELTDLAAECERVSNYHFVADREGGEVTFLYSVAAGAAAASYGIDVARLAGVPEGVVDRSHDLVAGETARTTAGDDGDDAEESGRSDPAVNGHRSTEKRSTIGTEATTGPTNGGRAGGDALLPDDTLIPTRNGAEHGTRERNDATRGVSNDGKRRGTGATTDRGIETTLRTLDIANTTPIEALFTLNELKNRLDDEPTERHGTD